MPVNREHPLRQYLDGVIFSKRVPRQSDIASIELADHVSDAERSRFVAEIATSSRDIVDAMRVGDQDRARALAAEVASSHANMVDVEAMADQHESPRDVAAHVRRGVA